VRKKETRTTKTPPGKKSKRKEKDIKGKKGGWGIVEMK